MVLLSALFALALHEGAHYFTARKRGFAPAGFSLSPFGATMSFDSGLCDADEFVVSLAGPAANLLLCPLLVTLWWFFPSTYSVTNELFRSSFALALFNLLPVYPFDGGRLLCCLTTDKVRMQKKQKAITIVTVSVLVVLGAVFTVFGKGTLFFFAAATVIWYGLFPSENDRYKLIFSQLGVLSSPVPLVRKDVFVEGCVTVKKTLSFLHKRNTLYVLHVTENGRETCLLRGEALDRLFFGDRKGCMRDVAAKEKARYTNVPTLLPGK